MRLTSLYISPIFFISPIWIVSAYRNGSSASLLQSPFSLRDERPPGCPECPRCFDCKYEEFACAQFAECSQYNGKCVCPPGFGGDDCSEPVCESLADGKQRAPREGQYCDCKEGWEGVNCNVCTDDFACNAMMPPQVDGQGGVCYKHGPVVKENFQMCNVTNRKILDQLKEKKPQATFSCNADDKTCNFQFWVDQIESFYCALDTCSWSGANYEDRNETKYECDNIKCKCVPGRMLCGEEGSIDIGDFLREEIKGPATFRSQLLPGSLTDLSKFEEPAMNDLIKQVFGDKSIFLSCRSGECLYKTDVPGYEKPIKEINTPVIAGVIAGCALLIVALILVGWYLARRAEYRRYGTIRLDDSDDEGAKLLSEHKAASLQFENVSYNLYGKQILSGIQGIAHAGELMAIMGASGAGKTTFLDILARKNKRGVTSGNFYVNGEKVNDNDFRSVVGFVDQEDTMLPTLTVHETILTSALLRLPRDMGRNAKEQRVYEVERQLGIYHIKDQIIGSEEGQGRGVSGGEKRRVGIACELVTSPSILFLDEPTSGLDAFNAFNVVECLVTLAKTYNRTVIFTIHQPRSNIVALFDQLVLLAKGNTVYSGPFSACQAYFDNIGYSCPPGFNIADYLVDLTMHAGTAQSPLLEEGPIDLTQQDGLKTTSSSMRAIKSIASASNISADTTNYGSPKESLGRPKTRRRQSLKQKQDRQLYTRKKSNTDDNTPPTPRTDDEDNVSSKSANPQDWLKLSKQHGAVPPQILEDPDHLPPPASNQDTDLDIIVSSYVNSEVASSIHDEINAAVHSATTANGGQQDATHGNSKGIRRTYRHVSLLRQFIILSQRMWRNLYRNPMLMLTHYAIAILLAVLSGYLFYGLTEDIAGFQNRLGLFFFILALFGFSTLTSLTVFQSERLLFMRERANGYYHPITYFAAKVVFDILPLRLIPPIILGVVVYPMVGLVPAWPEFFQFVLILVLFNFAAAAICLFIGIVFREASVANLIGSLTMLFSLLFAGLLLNHDKIPKGALWLQTVRLYSNYPSVSS